MLTAQDFRADLYAGWKARYGMEHRDPVADRRIVEFCLSIPEAQFLHGIMAGRFVRWFEGENQSL